MKQKQRIGLWGKITRWRSIVGDGATGKQLVSHLSIDIKVR
jgi:hypothetical protein